MRDKKAEAREWSITPLGSVEDYMNGFINFFEDSTLRFNDGEHNIMIWFSLFEHGHVTTQIQATWTRDEYDFRYEMRSETIYLYLYPYMHISQ